MTKKILVIGAGPAGLTCAYELSKDKSCKIKTVEISSRVGGMARSFKLFNQTVDLGPHRFFSSDNRVNKLWLEVIGTDYKIVNRLTRIFYKKKYYYYPLKPLNAFFNLGFFNVTISLISYFKYKFFPLKNEEIFSSWIINRFGKKLYDIFFKSYTEKLWGIDPDKLSSDFAKQRIKDFSLGQAIKNVFFKNTFHKTLVDEFAYPLKGNGYVYEKMLLKYIKNKGIIEFNSSLKLIEFNDDKYDVVFSNGDTEKFDYVISTMPIDSFLKIFKNYKFKIDKFNLKFRNTILVYSKVKQSNLFEDQWIYIQDEKIKAGRITNFNNWIPELINNEKGSLLANEYWAYDDDELWNMNDGDLHDICYSDLKACGFLDDKKDIIDFKIIRVPKCYPVYSGDYKNSLLEIQDFLKSYKNLSLIGRYGSFKYNNQDHSILMGYLCSRNILLDEENNLWEINSDYKYHESSRISESGLIVN